MRLPHPPAPTNPASDRKYLESHRSVLAEAIAEERATGAFAIVNGDGSFRVRTLIELQTPGCTLDAQMERVGVFLDNLVDGEIVVALPPTPESHRIYNV